MKQSVIKLLYHRERVRQKTLIALCSIIATKATKIMQKKSGTWPLS
jgi:hypothetical protein